MIRFAADENFNGKILGAMMVRIPGLNVVRLQDTGMAGAEDPAILEWCWSENRVLLTYDAQTIPGFLGDRAESDKHWAGVIIVRDRMPIGQAVEQIHALILGVPDDEWLDKLIFLPNHRLLA